LVSQVKSRVKDTIPQRSESRLEDGSVKESEKSGNLQNDSKGPKVLFGEKWTRKGRGERKGVRWFGVKGDAFQEPGVRMGEKNRPLLEHWGRLLDRTKKHGVRSGAPKPDSTIRKKKRPESLKNFALCALVVDTERGIRTCGSTEPWSLGLILRSCTMTRVHSKPGNCCSLQKEERQ